MKKLIWIVPIMSFLFFTNWMTLPVKGNFSKHLLDTAKKSYSLADFNDRWLDQMVKIHGKGDFAEAKILTAGNLFANENSDNTTFSISVKIKKVLSKKESNGFVPGAEFTLDVPFLLDKNGRIVKNQRDYLMLFKPGNSIRMKYINIKNLLALYFVERI